MDVKAPEVAACGYGGFEIVHGVMWMGCERVRLAEMGGEDGEGKICQVGMNLHVLSRT